MGRVEVLMRPAPQVTPPWEPIAPAGTEGRIITILEGILEAFSKDGSRLQGHPDLLLNASLFLGYLSLRPEFESTLQMAESTFGLAVEAAGEAPGPALFRGFAGLGWHAAHLGALLDWDVEELCAGIDALILDQLQGGMVEDFDLVTGLVGVAVYGAERRSHPILAAVLNRLEEKAQRNGGGVTWPTHPTRLPDWQREICPDGYLNLGVAHGIPGVMAALALIATHGVQSERATSLLAGARTRLEARRQESSVGSLFPKWIPIGTDHLEPPSASRIAWCYGDLGAAQALLLSARSTQDSPLEGTALDAARMSALRPHADSGVKDACLCHGSIGNAHIFNRLYQATGNPTFLAKAQGYLQLALETFTPVVGFKGFTQWPPEPAADNHGDPSLLEGISGIGLGLLATLGGPEPAWDRLMLLSFAPSFSRQTPP